MTLKDDIRDEMVKDEETVLETHLDDVKEMVELHSDGTINITEEYRGIPNKFEILLYLIGQRFAYEAELVDTDEIEMEFFYKRIDKSDRTVRNYIQGLREAGLVEKTGQSSNKIITENLSKALDQINNAAV